jgi:hypothetical protein
VIESYGYPLKANYVRDPERQALTAVRAIVSASANPKVHLSVDGLAEATGLTPDVVEELLTSDAYKEMLIGTCKQRVAGCISKGITRLETILSESQDEELVLEAMRAVTTLYRTMNQDAAGHRQSQSRVDGEELIKNLVNMNRLAGPNVSVVEAQPTKP